MGSFKRKRGNFNTFNNKLSFYQLRSIRYHSRVGLYIIKLMLVAGLFLIVLDNAGYLTKDSYFGGYNWPTLSVFVIGAFLSYLAIPFLYYSSFDKFKRNDDFWDQEMFWILPVFFFATFFQYGSGVYYMVASLIVSIFIVFAIHTRFMLLSHKMVNVEGDYEKKYQYYDNMNYLTAYYFLLLFLFVFFDPVEMLKKWTR